LATVCGLTIGDYLLWNWSLNANHAVLGLISGLTLPPLAIAFVWLLVLTLARLVANASRDVRGTRARTDPRTRKATRTRARVPATPRPAAPRASAATSPAARASSAAPAAPASSPARASRKIAA
jgi:predicted lipid-binding transport protein (Tim44 family)